MAWLPMPYLSLVLLLAWPLLMGEFSVLSLIGGLVFAWLLPLLCVRFAPDVPHARRPAAIVRLMLVVLHDIVQSNIVVARLVLGDPARLRPVFVEVPVDSTHPYVANLLASIITMTPGTVSARVLEPDSDERPVIIVHALDSADPEALVRDIKARYEAPLMEIFPC